MALSNWLTRDEWNAVYFAGLKLAIDGAECKNMGDQLRLGIGALNRAGYNFTGIVSTPDGDYEKVSQCCNGNETVLAEMMGAYGGFDKVARAKEVLAWTGSPEAMDWSWLREALKEVE